MIGFALIGFVPPAVTLTDDLRRRHVRVLRAALRHADLSLDTAAREAERDLSQFRRQLIGTEGSFASLWKQPPAFWQWLAVVLASEFGLPVDVRRAMQLRRVALERKRMARVELTARKEQAS